MDPLSCFSPKCIKKFSLAKSTYLYLICVLSIKEKLVVVNMSIIFSHVLVFETKTNIICIDSRTHDTYDITYSNFKKKSYISYVTINDI